MFLSYKKHEMIGSVKKLSTFKHIAASKHDNIGSMANRG